MLGEASAAAIPPDLIKDATEASFMADVVEASRVQPVIVDFWAPWCGPCKQLGPALEKAVAAAKGAVKLVKVDIDKNPRIASQLRVQSIPTVYAFVDGQPVDGFMGAVPDSQIKAFIDRLAGPPEAGDAERAREILAMAPEGAKDPELDSVRTALDLAADAPAELKPFEQALAKDENDHAARLELAKALAGRGQLDEAVDQLLRIIETDLDWNEGAARAQLLKVFEAAGPGSETARRGRRRLSSILFS